MKYIQRWVSGSIHMNTKCLNKHIFFWTVGVLTFLVNVLPFISLEQKNTAAEATESLGVFPEISLLKEY